MRSNLSRKVLALILTSVIALNLACSTAQLVKLADRAGSVAVKLKPVIAPLVASGQLPADLPDRLDQFHDITGKLADAFRNQTGNAIELTATAIRLVETFINDDAVKIQDPGTRTLVLAILAGADIALGEISDSISGGAANHPAIARGIVAAHPEDSATVASFAKKPRLRCRDSKTGRFAKMEICEANPDTTTVERVGSVK